MLRVGMQTSSIKAGTESVGQHRMHSHAERGNEKKPLCLRAFVVNKTVVNFMPNYAKVV